MIINNSIVKKKVNSDSINYEYFSCTCDDKDEEFYKKIIQIFYPDANSNLNINRRATYFVKCLHKLGWKFNGCGADMWMGASFSKHSDRKYPKQSMFIQCDELEFGMVAALLIAERIGKEQN